VYLITGGAGFIGSNIAAGLDQLAADIVISDWLGKNDLKWLNIAKRRLLDIIPTEARAAFLDANHAKIDGIFHMGAIPATTETDIDAARCGNWRSMSPEVGWSQILQRLRAERIPQGWAPLGRRSVAHTDSRIRSGQSLVRRNGRYPQR
jgi:hypothetical protein